MLKYHFFGSEAFCFIYFCTFVGVFGSTKRLRTQINALKRDFSLFAGGW